MNNVIIDSFRDTTIDRNGQLIIAGTAVLCIDDVIGGDSDSSGEWDFVAGQVYHVESIFDEDNLIHPMLSIRGSKNGPVLSQRFIVADGRYATDAANNILCIGDTVFCTTDVELGDTGSDFNLVRKGKYVIDSLVDDNNQFAPMICLADNDSGPVFPERFKKVVRIRG
ncbi:MAG: hypothetical protein GY774_35265 [Planctomycetes bacterium]|nr:hypothetical protein [Planctomycetota bacterium]